MSNKTTTPTTTTTPEAPNPHRADAGDFRRNTVPVAPAAPLTGQELANAEAQKLEDAKVAETKRKADEEAHLIARRAAPVAPLSHRDEESLEMSEAERSRR